MKINSFLIGVLVCLLLSACQEIQITIEVPEQAPQAIPSPSFSVSITEENDDTSGENQQKSTEDIFSEPEEADQSTFDPHPYFFSEEALPQDIVFYSDNEKTFLVSYLNSPGSLLGIAHIREYFSYSSDLFIAQNIIQSPVEVQSIMLHSGHNGDQYLPVDETHSLGEESVIYHGEDGISYRFYKNNIMVVVDVRGGNPWVTEEHAYQLAKCIAEKLPETFPAPTVIESPSLELNSELKGKYFNKIELVDCYPPHEITDPVIQTELGYCFKADINDVIYNLKTGIYDNRYEKLVYMKEFLLVPQLGEWITGLFFPVWGFGWQHFHEGDYEAYFWVNDQLVEVVPFSLVIENQ